MAWDKDYQAQLIAAASYLQKLKPASCWMVPSYYFSTSHTYSVELCILDRQFARQNQRKEKGKPRQTGRCWAPTAQPEARGSQRRTDHEKQRRQHKRLTNWATVSSSSSSIRRNGRGVDFTWRTTEGQEVINFCKKKLPHTTNHGCALKYNHQCIIQFWIPCQNWIGYKCWNMKSQIYRYQTKMNPPQKEEKWMNVLEQVRCHLRRESLSMVL